MLHERQLDARFERQLAQFLAGRTCLLGIGSRWWRDDGAGSRIAGDLQDCPDLDAINAGWAPENHLETVAKKHPDTILLVDAADFGGAPGTVRLLPPEAVAEAGLSTHASSLRLLAEYLQQRTGARVAVLAIQPQDTGSGQKLTPAVEAAVQLLEELLPRLCRASR